MIENSRIFSFQFPFLFDLLVEFPSDSLYVNLMEYDDDDDTLDSEFSGEVDSIDVVDWNVSFYTDIFNATQSI
jgi:hypothetical protein